MMGKLLVGILVIVILVLSVFVFFDVWKVSPSSVPVPNTTGAAPAVTSTPSTSGGNIDANIVQMKAENKTISIIKNGFSPNVVVVVHGSAITWENNSDKTATIVSSPVEGHTEYAPLNLGEVKTGQTVLLEFDTVGTYGFKNGANPSQTGAIIVL